VKYSESWKIFDKIWKEYEFKKRKPGYLIDSFFEKLRVKELDDFFGGKETIVNVGSGSGRWSLPFLRLGYKVTNFDMSHYALLVSKKRCRNLKANYVRGDAFAIPFKNNSFDIVMSFGLIEHFKDVTKPIDEMVRILKPHGLFFADIITKRISVQRLQSWINYCLYLFYVVIHLNLQKIRKSIWFLQKDYFENSLSTKEYLTAMEKAGLSKINITGIRAFPIVMLPFFIERFYLPVFRLFGNFFVNFDRSNTKFSKFWGAIWELRGIKQ